VKHPHIYIYLRIRRINIRTSEAPTYVYIYILYIYIHIYIVAQKESIFSNNCNAFIFNKNYVNTKTACNKCIFDYLHWLLNYGKPYRKYGVLLVVHTSGDSSQNSASHLLTFLVAQLQFLREWKLSDRRLYDVSERRLLIWGNPKERNRRQIKKHVFFLRHSVYVLNNRTSETIYLFWMCFEYRR